MIHIVEDDTGVADAMAVLLGQMGHDVRSHASAESVFDAAPPGPADAVIVDLSLPGIEGGNLVRWLTSLAAPPRVLVVTGQHAEDIEAALDGVRAPTLLRKPVDPGVFARLFGEARPAAPARAAGETCEADALAR